MCDCQKTVAFVNTVSWPNISLQLFSLVACRVNFMCGINHFLWC